MIRIYGNHLDNRQCYKCLTWFRHNSGHLCKKTKRFRKYAVKQDIKKS